MVGLAHLGDGAHRAATRARPAADAALQLAQLGAEGTAETAGGRSAESHPEVTPLR